MALSPELAQFKSSGVYRLEFDKSQTANIPADQLRLVVGFSKKGPFNTPVFVPDPSFFLQVFGPIDRSLERNGSYFHRTALAALERGPIIALNLLRLNDDLNDPLADKVKYQVLSTSATKNNPLSGTALYSGFYNRDRFWFPEDKAFLQNIGLNKGLLQFVNLKQSPITILVRQIQETRGFDITAKEWFGASNVPEFMHPEDYISDYMIEVIAIDGDFTNYQKLSIDPLFSKYFHPQYGLIKSELENFLNLKEVTVLGRYKGILIPDFIDLNGNNLFIQDLINFETPSTGLFCAIDKKLFDNNYLSGVENGIDIIGHNLEYKTNNDSNFKQIDFLSYKKSIKNDLAYTEIKTHEIGINVNMHIEFSNDNISFNTTPVPSISSYNDGTINYWIKINKSHSQYHTDIEGKIFVNKLGSLNTKRITGSYILMTDGNNNFGWAPIFSITDAGNALIIGLSVAAIGYYVYMDGNNKFYFISKPDWFSYDSVNSVFLGAEFTSLYQDYINGIITSGDKVQTTGLPSPTFYYIKFIEFDSPIMQLTDDLSTHGNGTSILGSNYSIPSVKIEGFTDSDFTSPVILPDFTSNNYYYSDNNQATNNEFIIQSLTEKLNMSIVIDQGLSANLPSNEIYISAANYEGLISPGDYLVSDEIGPNGESRLTKIIKVSKEVIGLTSYLHIYTIGAIKKITSGSDVIVERYKKIDDVINYYNLFALPGFKLKPNYHLPNGTQAWIDSLYDYALNPSGNLFNALIDKDLISYRYIVDSFGLGISSGSKAQLAYLAKKRQNAFAILNAPSMEDFKRSMDPRFVDDTGALSTRFISEGGDLSKNPQTVYSLPSIEQGANYCAFYTPYLVVRDRGKNITVPPAGYVSNLFISKYTNALPWSIVAGPRRGVITGSGIVGLEINFTKQDRDYLEPFGLNPIIFQKGVGLVITGNKTAQQNIKSALSSIHVREVLIYIQDGLAEILKSYQWEFNTAQTRLEIVTLANQFMETVQRNGGIYDFRNIMDTTNNTPDIIDANMGILDTYIEPVKGLEILVHRTTILKTGSIATGQFK